SDPSGRLMSNHLQEIPAYTDEPNASLAIAKNTDSTLSEVTPKEVAESLADVLTTPAVTNIPPNGASDAALPEVQNTMISLKEIMVQLLANLSDRERDIIAFRFGLNGGRPWTLEEIGKHIGVTRERVRQIETKVLRALRHPQYHRILQPLVLLLEPALKS